MIPTRYKEFYGDETRWFIGTVVDLNDPMELGRIRVRIMGIHTDDKQQNSASINDRQNDYDMN